jgi:malate dehydrogenase, NAD-dependent
MKKVTIIGAGNVGANCAFMLAQKNFIEEIVLLDVKQGLAEGKALDIWESAPINVFETKVIGVTKDYEKTAGSEITVITSGMTRKPGMSRDDLIFANAAIVKEVTENVIKYSPNTIIVIVSNPLDVMTYVAYRSSGFNPKRVLGMAGILDLARYRTFLADELHISPNSIQALLLGGHGDSMVPLPNHTSVNGIPISELVPPDKLEQIIQRTIKGGAEIINLLDTSAWMAPAAAVTQMVSSIGKDKKTIFPVCTLLQGQYNLNDVFLSVPVILGSEGVEQIIDIKLSESEMALLHKSADSIKSTIKKLQEQNFF